VTGFNLSSNFGDNEFGLAILKTASHFICQTMGTKHFE